MISQRLDICFFSFLSFLCKVNMVGFPVYLWLNDSKHLDQPLPEESGHCTVGSSLLYSVSIQQVFAVLISILQNFSFLPASLPVCICTPKIQHIANPIGGQAMCSRPCIRESFLMACFWKASSQLLYKNILHTSCIYSSSGLQCFIKYTKWIYVCRRYAQREKRV